MTNIKATVRAAGTVLWRPDEAGLVRIAVVHRPRYDDWSLPKGKLESGETVPACAVRETAEETGFRAVLGRWLGEVTYPVDGVDKHCGYFAARAGEGRFAANPETDELRWLAPEEASDLLSYAGDRQIAATFAALPADTATVLLVRHAKAGNRSAWTGNDAERPLSKAGQQQAGALRTLLPLFGPDAVYAAPRVRCAQTIAGLAAELGVSIRTEPACGDEGQAADPAGAARRLAELARGGGVPAICGQGGAIPALLEEFAHAGGLAPDRIACKKGSLWVLSFAPGTARLVAADYLASPLPIPQPAG